MLKKPYVRRNLLPYCESYLSKVLKLLQYYFVADSNFYSCPSDNFMFTNLYCFILCGYYVKTKKIM